MRSLLTPVTAGMFGALIMWVGMRGFGSGYDVIVLHRAGNPPSTYMAKFDALGSATLNMVSCNEFKGFVEKLSPETGSVTCSPMR